MARYKLREPVFRDVFSLGGGILALPVMEDPDRWVVPGGAHYTYPELQKLATRRKRPLVVVGVENMDNTARRKPSPKEFF